MVAGIDKKSDRFVLHSLPLFSRSGETVELITFYVYNCDTSKQVVSVKYIATLLPQVCKMDWE